MQKIRSSQKGRLLVSLSILLCFGYITTSFVSFFVSRAALRSQIDQSTLPLTSDNIYSEIQRDLLRPTWVSLFMASDTFLLDWILDGEQDTRAITKYLQSVMDEHQAFTSFFVSEATRKYYHPTGVIKTVQREDPQDKWYFRVRDMANDYEINVDQDTAHPNTITIFINRKVYSHDGNYLGATGVGLLTNSVQDLIQHYREKYHRDIYFVDLDGNILIHSASMPDGATNIRDMDGLASVADSILAGELNACTYKKNGRLMHLNTRYIPELQWRLLVEQAEDNAVAEIFGALVANLALCSVIIALALAFTALTTSRYEKTNRKQQQEIINQHDALLEKNKTLEMALAKVRTLTGLLPICASCKKIRDDKGYWNRIEHYISEHSEAEFSHSICPECLGTLYPDFKQNNPADGSGRPES